MFGFTSLTFSLLLTWMLPSTESQHFSTRTVMLGDDVTLTCEGYKEFHDECKNTTWLTSISGTAVPLLEHGKIHKDAVSKSDRLSVTATCFLLIKKVRVEDAGLYNCRQFNSSGSTVTDSLVQLSVTNKKKPEPKVTSSPIPPSPMATTSRPTSGAHPENEPETTSSTNKSVTATPAGKAGTNPGFLQPLLISAAVGLLALLITVMIIRWKKTKGRESQMDDMTELNLNSAGSLSGPATSQDMADRDDVVHYTSIGNMSSTRAPVHGKDNRVTYCTVKAPVAASTDVYSTIQEYR